MLAVVGVAARTAFASSRVTVPSATALATSALTLTATASNFARASFVSAGVSLAMRSSRCARALAMRLST